MADTTFIDQVTVIPTDWLNDLNRLHYTLLADPTTTQEIIDALPIATTSTNGTMSAADKTKIDGLLGEGSTGTKVFTSVSSEGTDEDVTIAPGLSTDDMDFGFSVLGATNQEVRVGVRNLDGYSHTMNEEVGGFSENLQVASMTAPAANLLTIKVYNSHTAAQNITVRWWARAR